MACILFADDEVSIRDMLARHLKAAGHECLKAQNGAEARALMENHSVDIALLDIMMPGEDGFSLAPIFLEKNIPVLCSENHPQKGYSKQAYMTYELRWQRERNYRLSF